MADAIEAGIEEVLPFVQSSPVIPNHGVCKDCYGRNLATGSEVEVGEAVGTIAAQSIRGTWYPADHAYLPYRWGCRWCDITQGLPRIQEIFEARNLKGQQSVK